MRAVIACALITTAVTDRAAEAETPVRVLVLDATPREGFLSALRIQVAGQAVIVPGAALPDGSVVERMAAASARIVAKGASLAIWFDDNGAGAYIVYAVGAGGDRGLIEIGRATPGDQSNTDRVLALKVSALLDDLLAEPKVTRVLTSPLAAEVQQPASPGKPRTHFSVVASLAAAGNFQLSEPTSKTGAIAGIGLAARRGHWAGSVLIRGHWLATERVAIETGDALLSEKATSLSVAATRQLGPVRTGPAIEFGVRLLEAEGSTDDGGSGAESSSVPYLGLGWAVELQLGAYVATWVSIVGQLNLVAETLTLRGAPAARIDRVGAPVSGGVLLRVPL